VSHKVIASDQPMTWTRQRRLAGRTGQPLVAGDQDDGQQFGKGYVRGVARRQLLSHFPTACEQLSMRDPLQ
jgi:hypothetical protein